MRFVMTAVVVLCLASPALGQNQPPRCFFLCEPKLKVEPTFTWENWAKAPRIEVTDGTGNTSIMKLESESVFETVIAVDIPTTVPRIGFTFETILKPFEKGASPELETEFNFQWLRSEDTGGWVGSHFDVIDKYSRGALPHNLDDYTHKLNFELDTAVSFLKWTKKPWLSDIEVEASLDYVASGLPRAGDRFGNVTYLDNASRWGFSLVFVVPLAPLR
ncbi:MAG TPA: hypothetical protein VFR18_03140 [Terriglobia bacterium]|nr:hypothetical protein [Terriglobia bacterium]